MIEQSSFGDDWVSSVFGPFRIDRAREQLWRDDGALVALKPKTSLSCAISPTTPGA